MLTLFPFQLEASTTIADRYRAFVTDEDRPRLKGYGPLPFYQGLQALTGSGKTPILADTIAQIRTVHPVEPIILWISKGKVVVDQTLANFVDGGKYAHLIAPLEAKPLRDCIATDVNDGSTGLVLLGTVATFNSKERGDRLIFGVREDSGQLPLWDALIERKTSQGVKRPLIVVYDEGHNLSDQQANILLELRPDGIIVASATPRLPLRITEIIDLLIRNGYSNDDLRTSISSRAVVEAELVKRQVQLGGYVTAEEVAISAMLADHRDLIDTAAGHEVPFVPKCIYVCKTNLKDDEQKPFAARQSPPIRIWRYLVEKEGIDPDHIAVYCDLNTSGIYPLPSEFVLFKGGDNDYADFVGGDYKHIIFNLSLQEGWDDPECYLAYIDKSMGSELQVEQIIGRVLRQPGATYYPDAKLNTCGFYIHVDEAGIFAEILQGVQQRLAQDMPAVDIINNGGSNRSIISQTPRFEVELPEIYISMAEAAEAVQEVLDKVSEYKGSPDAITTGQVAQVSQEIGKGNGASELEWHDKGQGMPVTVQWFLGRQIERQYPAARVVSDMNDQRFSRLIHIGSRAAKQLETQAGELVTTFLQNATIGVMPTDPRKIGTAAYDANNYQTFTNSIHPAYSGLNPDEMKCAQAIDTLGWRWYRNPENGGFALPLFNPGTRRSFYPDFVIWTNATIWLVDPKGDHLITSDAGRKLIAIDNLPGALQMKVCLITEGTWDKTYNKLNGNGVTAWLLRSGTVNSMWFSDMSKLLQKVVGVKK